MDLWRASLWFMAAAAILIPSNIQILVAAGKLLVVPADGSHWLSMRSVVELLIERGHHVVVVAPESNMNLNTSHRYEMKTYPVTVSKQQLKNHFQSLSYELFTQRPFLEKIKRQRELLNEVGDIMINICTCMLNNGHLMQSLKESYFDAIFTDPISLCGQILAELLSVPSVFFLREVPCHLDAKATLCPLPLSYVPRFFTGLTDRMTFFERLRNLLIDRTMNVHCSVVYSRFQRLISQILQRDLSVLEILSHGSIWLLRQDFVLQFPKPIMPNMIFIGGINCVQRKPLAQEFDKLVNSSGEHGFVVFSFGSMISEIPMDKAMIIAKALGSIPQKVIWRYTGTVPSNLAENTHLFKWLPQNDLLAHPMARAFITHAGSHGIYEAICNAVPVVMLPLFTDQMDNAVRIESRGAGVTLNVLDMTSEDLSNALQTVIEDPSYKKNMEHLSALHLDRPIHPLDLAVYWVEFVMRHKGAPHLRPAAHELNFFQYHSLDIIGFLLLVMITTLFISLKCCCFVFRRCCGKRPSKSQSKTKAKSKPE